MTITRSYMKNSLSIFTVLFGLIALTTFPLLAQDNKENTSKVYSYLMKDIDGKTVSLEQYKGEVLLIINTASECGFTPQYATMEKLYKKYKDQGFRILAFPANNFGQQEPGTNEEIKAFCTTNFETSFNLFSKISVRGDDIDPLYAFLTEESPFPGAIKWNFHKFLIDQSGTVVARWDSRVDPMSKEISGTVAKVLASD
jgi:glutathione peroxidase